MTLLDPPATALAGAGPAPGDSFSREDRWVDVCAVDRLTVERGAAARVSGRTVALFRLGDDEVVAIDDVDPFWDVAVLSRGLVGHVGGRDTVASPLHKQRFDLRTGACLDDPRRGVATWPVRVHDGRVEVRRLPASAAP